MSQEQMHIRKEGDRYLGTRMVQGVLFKQIGIALHRNTRGSAELEHSEMVRVLGLQRTQQDLKPRKLA
jgi:hypothetical protein